MAEMPGRIVALDVGDVRTGVAATDPMQVIASPHSVVKASSRAKAVAAAARILRELDPVLLVVGLPLDGSGEIGPQARKVQDFVALLKAEIEVEVVYQDERFTTVSAEEMLLAADLSRKKRKNVVDKIAATHILQRYMAERAEARQRQRTFEEREGNHG